MADATTPIAARFNGIAGWSLDALNALGSLDSLTTSLDSPVWSLMQMSFAPSIATSTPSTLSGTASLTSVSVTAAASTATAATMAGTGLACSAYVIASITVNQSDAYTPVPTFACASSLATVNPTVDTATFTLSGTATLTSVYAGVAPPVSYFQVSGALNQPTPEVDTAVAATMPSISSLGSIGSIIGDALTPTPAFTGKSSMGATWMIEQAGLIPTWINYNIVSTPWIQESPVIW